MCTCTEGIEYAGTIEEIETKLPRGKSLKKKEEIESETKDKYYPKAQATWRSLRQKPQMDTIYIYIYPFKLVKAPCLFWLMVANVGHVCFSFLVTLG